MRRILFVDDEPRILDGLSRMLRSLRSEWEMVFAQGGREALDACACAPFDVVVSDARMPGMDGFELLNEIIRLYPDTVRIILSGQCSRDSVLQSVGVAHQFLSKPCASLSLKATVQRVCGMRALIRDGAARTMISCVQRLPSQAAVYAELANEVTSAAASIERVAEIITRDVAMCLKVMQLVSSEFFGTPQRVMDAAHAVRLLGLDTVKAVLDSSAAFEVGDFASPWEETLQLLNDHSSAVAACAKQIAETVTDHRTTIEDTHLSGMLHDIAALALFGSSRQRRLVPSYGGTGPATTAGPGAEADSDEVSPDAGGYLAALWGLPDPIAQAIGYYRLPSNCPEPAFGPLTAVHAAHALLEQPGGESTDEFVAIDMDYLRKTGCISRLESWREICATYSPEGASR